MKDIMTKHGVGDQHHLLMELKRHGIDTTQATISRDLHDMGFIKVREEAGVYKYEYFEKKSEHSIWERLKVMFKNFVTDVKSTGNLILIKTSPGNANGVASLIDGLQRKEILGTVAGDDTILVVLDNQDQRKKIENNFRQLLEKAPRT